MSNLFALFLLLLFTNTNAQQISTAKPWTYWWWMGSAVTKEGISKQLDFFCEKGLGGVHIIPIYGVKGFESANLSFLSKEWIEILEYTVSEGKKRGLGVDLTTGTGWPFGGPNVTPHLAAQTASVHKGRIETAPTKQKVKRAAPGGEGFVLDPFHKMAMQHYLQRFDTAFAVIKNLPRSMYMDSYEAYGANWTEDFETQFKHRRGYDLRDQLDNFTDSTHSENADLVKIDYHQTLSELLLERYASPWTAWSKKHGFLTRYQAHGSPGNLLDLYAAAEIPETESFGTSRFNIPGLRIDPDYSIDQFGTPDPLAMKFASSAANFTGKKLVSSETGTWLANHFKVSLSQVKPQIDELFTAGINHVFYHGTTYSPASEPYPGWLFYASTNFGPNSHFSEQFALLNRYVENCQTLLQNSSPDNDILLYFPIHDLWATPAKSAGKVHLLEVHHVDRWLLDLPFGKLARKLSDAGFTFDYISDLQLKSLKVSGEGKLSAGSVSYKTILIPEVNYLPESTLMELKRLANAGVKIIFDGKLPTTVTGYFDHQNRQENFNREISSLATLKSVRISKSLNADLKSTGSIQEVFSSQRLSFIRKKTKGGQPQYFIANLSNVFSEGWIKVGTGQNFEAFDPANEKSDIPQRIAIDGKTEVYLTLPPGKSVFLTAGIQKVNAMQPVRIEKTMPVEGTWQLHFVEGKPSLPGNASLGKLISWSALPDSALYFSGKAHYTIHFDAADDLVKSNIAMLDLGDVRESAFVKLNGKELGTAWYIPFQLSVEKGLLKPKNNILEVEVTNLSANYMRLRDRQEPDWKKFQDINIVDITYKKFNASKWEPMPSGLLGPVRFIYE